MTDERDSRGDDQPGGADGAGASTGDPSPDGGVAASGATGTGDAAATAEPVRRSARFPSGDPLAAVATREYRILVRSRWAVGLVALFGLFTVAVVRFGGSAVGPGRADAVVATVVELGVYLVPLAAVAVGYDTVVGADERGSLELVLALPLSRAELLVGRFAGRAAVLGGATLVGFLPGGLVLTLTLGPGGLGAYAAVALAAVALGWAVLAIATLVSTVAVEKTHALGLSLAGWLWVVLLHDLVAFAAIAGLDLGSRAVAVAVLLNPVDCFRVLALSQVDVVAGGFGSVLAAAGLSVPVVAAALAGWVVVPTAVAARLLGRRRV
ncbi:ABC transporter permease [Haloglomus halophilum]|uniref:ABC transporter permease n=1 Tax=Haloglomus halophilum TaxID=2962672 RepID=UPI0020C94045|nr:ABC transporter permease [Haloglomus halophilum]